MEQQAALLVMASGRKAEIASLDERLAAFDAWLVSTPKHMDPDELELRQVLGV